MHPSLMRLEDSIESLRKGAKALSLSSNEQRQEALSRMAEAIERNKDLIAAANGEDISRSEKEGLPSSLIYRLRFTEGKILSAIQGLKELEKLPDPIGVTKEKRELDKGFVLERVTFPIGVIAMIFEARPDALVQIAGLALRSGNAVVLKGGKEAEKTNRVLIDIIREATLPVIGENWILGIESHSDVDKLLSLDRYIDLIIPRGSNSFVRYVMDHTHIPVIGHSDGICSVYVDEDADIDMAVSIAVDSKVQYPAACNAAETILVHRAVAASFLPKLGDAMREKGVKIHGDEETCALIPWSERASEEDYHTEYLALECAVKVVGSEEEAIRHIEEHGSHHTDAIVTDNEDAKALFFRSVDSADVFANCSTRFADGFRFGLGAEVGISTSKIHARGPVGLEGLMTTKWLLSGNGEIVEDYSSGRKAFHHKELI